MMGFRRPVCDHLFPLRKAADVQPFRVGGTTAETDALGRVSFLKTLIVHKVHISARFSGILSQEKAQVTDNI